MRFWIDDGAGGMTGQLGLEDEPREGETGQGEEGLEASNK